MDFVLQHDERDCGAACLSMVAKHYGLHYPISKYRALTKTVKTGTNLYGLVDGAKQIGLSAEALSGRSEELLQEIVDGKIKFPFIAHTISDTAMLHFVVVYGIKNGKFLVADPGKGKIQLSKEAFFSCCTGYYAVFEKTEKFQPGNYVKGSFSKFFSLLKGQYHKLMGVFIISLVISTIGILGAFIFKTVIDNFATTTGYYEIGEEADHNHEHEGSNKEKPSNPLEYVLSVISNSENYSNWNLLFVLVIGLYLLQAAIQFVRGCLIVSVSKKIDLRLTLSYYNHIIGLPVSSIAVRQTGEYLSRFSDAGGIRNAISGATLTIILDSVMVVVGGSILCLENVRLFVVALVMIVLYAVLVFLYRKPIEKNNREVMENNAVVQSYLKESIDGVEIVKAAHAEEQVKEKTTRKYHQFINSAVKNSLLSMSQDTLADAVELVGTVCILWLGFSMVLAEQVTIGSLITFYALLSYFTQPIKNLIELQPTIQTAFVAAERLNDILDLEQETFEKRNQTLPQINTWDFRNIDFRYGNRELTLKNVSLSIHRGEKIAIVGESGSGKTTLAKLLLRFYEPEQGKILIDGKDIRDTELSALRQSISYVDQNTFLFSDTIKNNLKLGNINATDEEIKYACKVSRADEFIQEMPMGYETPLDENGANLSGGQRQRLAIARAIIRKPQLLILDEATSNLDTITELSIKDTMLGLDDDLTCIIIAHRLTTIKNCDHICVMDKGHIVEYGTHEELIKVGGKYSALWNI